MKYLVLLAVLVIAYMVWRSSRIERRGPPAAKPGAATQAGPQEMIACPVCGLHLPLADAVTDSKGLAYCSREHRLLSGD